MEKREKYFGGMKIFYIRIVGKSNNYFFFLNK
jgi:hypothetical protein